MPQEDLLHIVLALTKKTLAGQAVWCQSPDFDPATVSSDDFVIRLADYTLNIYADPNRGLAFGIIDRQGRWLDTLEAPSPQSQHHQTLSELLDAARRSAFDIDEALAAIKTAIESDDPIGAQPTPKDQDEDDRIPF